MQDCFSTCARSVFHFIVFGPAFGMLAVLCLVPIKDPSELQKGGDIAQLATLMIVGLPLSYLIGTIPALLAGLLFGISSCLPGVLRHPLPCLLAGAGSGSGGCALFLLIPAGAGGDGLPFYAGIGGFAGACCGLLLRRNAMHTALRN